MGRFAFACLVVVSAGSSAWAQTVTKSFWLATGGGMGFTQQRMTDIDVTTFNDRVFCAGIYQSAGRGQAAGFADEANGAFVGSGLILDTSLNAGHTALVAAHNNITYYGTSFRSGTTAPRDVTLQKRDASFALGTSTVYDINGGSDDVLTILESRAYGTTTDSVVMAGFATKAGTSRWFVKKLSTTAGHQFTLIGEPNSVPMAVRIGDAGEVYVAYLITVGSVYQCRIAKYSATGAFQWRNGYNPTPDSHCFFADMQLVGDDIVCVGYVGPGAEPRRPMYARFNGAGARTQQEILPLPGFFRKVLPLADGHFMAAGSQEASGPGVILTRVEPGIGSTWIRKSTPGAAYVPTLADAEVDAWGNAYMAASTPRNDSAGIGAYVVKYAPNGTVQWTSHDYVAGQTRDVTASMLHPRTGQYWIVGSYIANGSQSMFRSYYSQIPVAVNDNLLVANNVNPVNGSCRSNDRYWQGATYQVVTAPVDGSLTLNADGTFTYTKPNPTFSGTRFFVYRIMRQGVNLSNNAIMTIQCL